MKQTGLFKNENVAVPDLPVVPPTKYHWEYVTANTDRTKGFTKVRISSNGGPMTNWKFSNLPGINTDGLSNSQCMGASYGRAGYLRTCNLYYQFGLHVPVNNDFTDFNSSWTDYTFTSGRIGTNVGRGLDGYDVYEYEYPITIYWSGVDNTSFYGANPYQVQIYIN